MESTQQLKQQLGTAVLQFLRPRFKEFLTEQIEQGETPDLSKADIDIMLEDIVIDDDFYRNLKKLARSYAYYGESGILSEIKEEKLEARHRAELQNEARAWKNQQAKFIVGN